MNYVATIKIEAHECRFLLKFLEFGIADNENEVQYNLRKSMFEQLTNSVKDQENLSIKEETNNE